MNEHRVQRFIKAQKFIFYQREELGFIRCALALLFRRHCMIMAEHRAGFVHIIGKPNAGKSTLFNALTKYPLSIATHKPQTTRQNLVGIDQGTDYQVVYVDTPGYLKPTSELQRVMMQHVNRALVESEVLLWLVDIRETEIDPLLIAQTQKKDTPLLVLLNKVDTIATKTLSDSLVRWEAALGPKIISPISALDQVQVDTLSQKIKAFLPVHPAYYEQDTLTDKSMRFFAADIVRKAIFVSFRQEIPYSTEVIVEHFQEKEHVIVLAVTIFTEKLSQKRILIGAKGQALKGVGTKARQELEVFFKKKVFLSQRVKVLPNWRSRKEILARWGY